MSKLLYSVTMSLDGFIAGPGDDMSWMTDLLGPNPLVDDLIPQIGALLVGNRTFGGDDPYRDDPERAGQAFGGGWDGPPSKPQPGVTFVTDLRSAISASKAAADGKYVNVLGASIARQCLEAGELDEVLTLIAPVMLGDGTRLFDHPGGTNIRLERLSVSDVPTATNLWWRVAQ
jgi:dihydrofolate reductase